MEVAKVNEEITKQWPPFDAYSPSAAIFIRNRTAFTGVSFIDSLSNSEITFLNSFYLRGTNGVKSLE
jgi:hypothetical protein